MASRDDTRYGAKTLGRSEMPQISRASIERRALGWVDCYLAQSPSLDSLERAFAKNVYATVDDGKVSVLWWSCQYKPESPSTGESRSSSNSKIRPSINVCQQRFQPTRLKDVERDFEPSDGGVCRAFPTPWTTS
jgi:hypothetical protein